MKEIHYDRINRIIKDDLTKLIVHKAELLTLLEFAYNRLVQLEDPMLLTDNELSKEAQHECSEEGEG